MSTSNQIRIITIDKNNNRLEKIETKVAKKIKLDKYFSDDELTVLQREKK